MQTYSLDSTTGIIPIINGEAFIVHNTVDLNAAMSMLSYRCSATIYVTQGNALWTSESESTKMTKGDLLIHKVTSSTCELIPENGFGMFAICVSSEFNRHFSQTVKIRWKIRQALITSALFHLSPEDRAQINENHDFLITKCRSSNYPQRPLILKHLLNILSAEMLLRLEDYIADKSGIQPTQTAPDQESIKLGNNTSSQVLFNRFANMLEKTTVKNRPVAWWAEQLNISPKYLSAICREIEGKSAKKLIANTVIQEATILLQIPGLTVKEISDRLGFVNQSHFGTFYKRHTGHSPMKDVQ